MAKKKTLKYPNPAHYDSGGIGLEIALGRPEELEEAVERFQEGLRQEGVKEIYQPTINFVIEQIEQSATKFLEERGEDNHYSHLIGHDDFEDENVIASAKSVVKEAWRLRSAIEDENWGAAILHMMHLTASGIRMEMFEYAMWGLHSDIEMRRSGKLSGKARQARVHSRNIKIIEAAKKLIREGKSRTDIAGILARKYSLSSRQIHNIFRKHQFDVKIWKPT